MSKEDENVLLSNCLDFARSFVEKETGFTFNMKTSSGFCFNLSNQNSGNPESTSIKKKKTASQLRMENCLEKKKEAFGVPEYELKIYAHE